MVAEGSRSRNGSEFCQDRPEGLLPLVHHPGLSGSKCSHELPAPISPMEVPMSRDLGDYGQKAEFSTLPSRTNDTVRNDIPAETLERGRASIRKIRSRGSLQGKRPCGLDRCARRSAQHFRSTRRFRNPLSHEPSCWREHPFCRAPR